MKSIICSLILLFSTTTALAADKPAYMPYPEAHISHAQWKSYRQMVYDTYASSLRVFPDENLEVLHSPDNVTHFAFTTSGHPAHPAWITRSAETGVVNQIGYFAGEEEPFAKLFQAYIELTDRTIESIPDKPTIDTESTGASSNQPGT